MVSRLADEILWMILAPCLTISEDDFESDNNFTFGSNDNVSSSGILLVCKRWMRIATPLLYEVIVLRSTGQTHALADVFKRNPHFGLHVKRIRLEATFTRLQEVFKRCTNLQSLFFVLDEIRVSDNSRALCLSLPAINPTRVHFRDVGHRDFDNNNANKRRIFHALCASIPAWTKLRDFYFPYPHSYFGGGPGVLGKRSLLAKALKESPSVEIIRSRTPREWDSIWSNFASNKRIEFYFDVDPENDARYTHFRSAMDGDPELKRAIHFVHQSPTSSLPKAFSRPSQNPLFSPLVLTDRAVSDIIWSRIFRYTLFEDYAEDDDLAPIFEEDLTETVYPMIRQRNKMSLVCKYWHSLIRRIFLHAPFVATISDLERLAHNLIRYPALGWQIHILSLNLSEKVIGGLRPRYKSVLGEIFRRLPRLRYFFNFQASAISWDLFETIGATAGNSLLKILNLNIEPCENAYSDVFSHLQTLEELEIHSLPAFFPRGIYIDFLAAVRKLAFGGATTTEPENFTTLQIPFLEVVQFRKATMHELRFLEFCGRNVHCLSVTFGRDGDGMEDSEVDLLLHCPRLETLSLSSDFLFCPRFLEYSMGSDTLEQIVVSARMGHQNYEPGSVEDEEHFLSKINFARYPRLTKIQFSDYKWPTDHRDIEKNYLIKKAAEIAQRTNVEIVDQSDKPFRPRVERRRRNTTRGS